MPDIPKPRKAPRQARSQHMVELILEASARVLVQRGYAGTSTNLIAETAGVSVGSIYQYFPNKEALIAALHERHGRQMQQVINVVLDGAPRRSLQDNIAALVRALLTAHMVEPALHHVLEREFPFFDAPKDYSPSDQNIYGRILALLEAHRAEIGPPNLELATYMLIRSIQTLVHEAVLEPPPQFSLAELEQAITAVAMGYLRYGAAPSAVAPSGR